MLSRYYQNYFPSKEIYKFLSNNDKDIFKRRELVFKTSEDRFPRPHFKTGTYEEFQTLLISAVPERIENVSINTEPYYDRFLSGPGFQRLEKELVFDIDIDDFDKVRICCKNSSYCKICWTYLMGTSIRFLYLYLVHIYGFKKVCWVFSGRRGMHCWVFDQKAKQLSEDNREYIMNEDIQYIIDPEKSNRKDILPCFVDLFVSNMYLYLKNKKDLFSDSNIIQHISELMFKTQEQQYTFSKYISSEYNKVQNSFKIIQKWITKIIHSKDISEKMEYKLAIILCGPKFDNNVTTRISHPIKLPFCVHPKTKYVCTVLNYQSAIDFYPDDEHVVKIDDLLNNEEKTKILFQTSLDMFCNLLEISN